MTVYFDLHDDEDPQAIIDEVCQIFGQRGYNSEASARLAVVALPSQVDPGLAALAAGPEAWSEYSAESCAAVIFPGQEVERFDQLVDPQRPESDLD